MVGDDGAVVGDDGVAVGDDGAVVRGGYAGTAVIAGLTGNLMRLSDEGVEGADGEERFAGTEAEALGSRDADAEACV